MKMIVLSNDQSQKVMISSLTSNLVIHYRVMISHLKWVFNQGRRKNFQFYERSWRLQWIAQENIMGKGLYRNYVERICILWSDWRKILMKIRVESFWKQFLINFIKFLKVSSGLVIWSTCLKFQRDWPKFIRIDVSKFTSSSNNDHKINQKTLSRHHLPTRY